MENAPALALALPKMALGFSICFILLGVCYGISTIASKATEAIARQPEAAKEIRDTIMLPCMLIEGASLIAMVFCFALFRLLL